MDYAKAYAILEDWLAYGSTETDTHRCSGDLVHPSRAKQKKDKYAVLWEMLDTP